MNSAAKKNDLIFILGMHRSGTSAVTRMIDLLGADLGSQLIAAEPGVNDKGFWENSELVDINEELLDQLDSGWFDYSELPDLWWSDSKFTPTKAGIERFLQREFSQSTLAALKDPRLCRLLSIWNETATQGGWQTKVLHVLRNPAEVRRSLLKRDPFTPLTADLLWLRYVADAERYSRETIRCWISYDQLMDNWPDTATRIATELELDWPVPIDEIRQTIDSEIDPKLRHHYGSNEEKSPISDELQAIYAALQESDTAQVDQKTLQSIKQLISAHQLCAPAIFRVNCRLTDATTTSHRIGSELEYAREIIAKREQEKSHTEAQLKKLGGEHEHALSVIGQRDEQLAKRNADFQELENWAKELEATAQAHWTKYEETELRHGQTINELHGHLRQTHDKLQQAQAKLQQISQHRVVGPLSRAFKLIDQP